MSQGGVSERVLFLRRRIAAIEARGGVARESLLDCPHCEEREDFLDPLFAAGRGSLSEVFPARPPDTPAAAAFALAMALKARAARASGALVFIVEDMSAREFGLPYGRGLAAAGVDLSRFALVRVRRPREALWAMEE
ncbi:MAG TPA: hypothetical protein VIF34_11045, partial [Methylocystis sp.]